MTAQPKPIHQPDADFAGPYCQWPRCECSPPDCEWDDAFVKHVADAQDCLDREMGS